MAMQAILLSWLKAVDVAMELVRLPDPFPNKTVRFEDLSELRTFSFLIAFPGRTIFEYHLG
jgi:hypothetical protein